MEQFYIRLKKAANTCAFDNLDKEVLSQIVLGCRSAKVRKYSLQTPTLTLDEVVNYAKTIEITDKHNEELETIVKANVNWIKMEDRIETRPIVATNAFKTFNKQMKPTYQQQNKQFYQQDKQAYFKQPHYMQEQPYQDEQLYNRQDKQLHYQRPPWHMQQQPYPNEQLYNQQDNQLYLQQGKTHYMHPEEQSINYQGGQQYLQLQPHYQQPSDKSFQKQQRAPNDMPTRGERYVGPKKFFCTNCGQVWHQGGLGECRARGMQCRACGKSGHFAKMCLTIAGKGGQQINLQSRYKPNPRNDQIMYMSNTDDEQQGHIFADYGEQNYDLQSTYIPNPGKEQAMYMANAEGDEQQGYIFANYCKESYEKETGVATIHINETPIRFTIDSGATVNVIGRQDFEKINPTPALLPSTKKIYSYSQSSPLNLKGQMKMNIVYKQTKYPSTFYVNNEEGPSLLSKCTSHELGLIKFVDIPTTLTTEHINTVDAQNSGNLHQQEPRVPETMNTYQQQIKKLYPGLFRGVGRHKYVKIKLHINQHIMPVANRHRRVPFNVRDQVEQELKNLEKEGIIEKIPGNTPTPWISPIVIVPKKDNKIRICVDMRAPNKAIMRERHVTPTLEDILYDLNGATMFSKLDLDHGYHQLELDSESRYITTFTTHIGLFQYNRLTFGITSAAEVFQNEIYKLIKDIPGATNMSDDILIFRRNKAEHDKTLFTTLKRLYNTGLTLNEGKCAYGKENLVFFGHIFSKNGISPDPGKVKAIAQAGLPESATEVRSLLGMCNFCARYIPDFATLSGPLRELTRKDVPWRWEQVHQHAYEQIMAQLSTHTQLSYYDKSLQNEIWTDASPVGIAAILLQRDHDQQHIIAFASRALSDTESRYSQIEREALAITWGMEHFRLYTYGGEVIVVTDHKPLIYLFNDPLSKLLARMERWRLRLQPYTFCVKYKEGKANPVDFLSRHPIRSVKNTQLTEESEEYINFLADMNTPKSISVEEVKARTLKDPTLQDVIARVQHGQWHLDPDPRSVNTHLNIFAKLKAELTTNQEESLLLRGHKLVLPLSLQDKVINLAHQGHQGIVKTKRLLRTKIWFPEMDKKTDEMIRSCLQCNAASPNTQRLPLLTSPLPEHPWECLHLDHKGPLPSGEYLLVLQDLYTRFPLVEIVSSTSAAPNMVKLNTLISMYGIPKTICTDNGPPFNGHEFAKFLAELGIEHRKTTPLWPQANGLVEKFNGTLAKILRIAHTSGQRWRVEMEKLLMAYRATPHSSTGISPAELMFNHPLNMGIPTIPQLPESPTINQERLRIKDTLSKQLMKEYHDQRGPMMKELPKVGDEVLVKQTQKTKMTTPFDIRPLVVTDVKGHMITSQRDGQQITRNATHFKVLPKPEEVASNTELNNDKNETQMDKGLSPDDNTLAPLNSPPSDPEKTNTKSQYNLRRETRPPRRLIQEMS